MSAVRNTFSNNIQIWLYKICGFNQLILRGRSFTIDESITRFYPLIVALILIIMEAVQMTHVYNDLEIGSSKILQTLSFVQSVCRTSCALLTVFSESFIFAKNKIIVYNNFQEVHNILYDRAFVKWSPFGKRGFFVMFVAFNSIQILLSWLTFWQRHYNMMILVILRSIVIALGVIEILTNIVMCNNYISSLNESLILVFTKHKHHRTGIDFKPTTLYHTERRDAREVWDLLQKLQNIGLKDYIKVFDLIDDNMKIISKRYAYMVILCL